MRPATITLLSALCALAGPAGGQEPPGSRPTLVAARADKPPAVDGHLEEAAWRTADVARDFVQQRPRAGSPATERTEARVLFTDEAIYVAATLFDSSPDSIVARLGRRDAELYSDWFWVYLDSQNDRRTAFAFGVSAAGVLRDALRANDTELHADWDAVWAAAVRRTSGGWTAELRIPLSQLRFALAGRGAEQRWGVNFAREIARREELSYWAPIPPTASGFVSLFGELRGLRDLEPARRLELRPYVAGRLTRAPGDRANPFFRRTDRFSSLGADVTYGLTSELTLTATVNPDFGQVEADPAQVNLTAHEMWLPERRPFFLEGADLFDVGYPQLFYSRRIGRSPQAPVPGDARYAETPEAATILAAAKLAGKTAGGWKVGVLDALTQREEVDYVAAAGERRSAVVEPMTNYAVARLVREFRGGRSGMGMVATAVHRDLGAEPRLRFLTARAFAGGVDGHHRFGKGDVRLTGSLRLSDVVGPAEALSRIQRSSVHRFQRPDADHLEFDSTRTSLSGARASLDLGKIGGRWRWGLAASVTTPGYEINDLGFVSQTDRRAGQLSLAYSEFRPGPLFRRWELSGFAFASSTTGGERTFQFLDLTLDAQLRNYWNLMAWVDWEPSVLSTEALRGGPAMVMPAAFYAYVRVQTDRRKPVIASLSGFLRRERGTTGRVVYVTPGLTVRPSTRMDLTLTPRVEWNREAAQYVTVAQLGDSTVYLFAPMRQTTATLTGRLNYTVSRNLTIEAYAQPFVSAGDYRQFKLVRDPRGPSEQPRFWAIEESRVSESRGDGGARTYGLDLDGDARPDVSLADPDFNTRQFRSNVVLRWEYRPGSTLFVAWSQSRDGFDADGSFALARDASRLFAARATNVVMVKVSYWLGL